MERTRSNASPVRRRALLPEPLVDAACMTLSGASAWMDLTDAPSRRPADAGCRKFIVGRRPGRVVARRAAVAALLAAAALSGCSIARLAYNNADWLVLREMDAYLDMSPEQEADATARLRARLEMHRRTELPGYARYLEKVRHMARDGLAPGEADWIVDQGYALARRTIRNAVPAVAPSLANASKRQIAHLESHLKEVNREYREEFLPDSRKLRLERRVRRTVSRIERWVGTLRPDQKRLAEKLRNEFPDSAEDWLAYNTEKQRALVKLLKAGANPPAVEVFLVRWWVELRGRSPSLELKNQAMLDGIKHLIVSVDATLDERQRGYLLWRLDDYLDQIETLRQQGSG